MRLFMRLMYRVSCSVWRSRDHPISLTYKLKVFRIENRFDQIISRQKTDDKQMMEDK